MKFVHFPGVDGYLSAPIDWDADLHGDCGGLPVMRHDGCVVSCWKPSWKERLTLLFGGAVYLWVVSGQTQPPVALAVQRRRAFLNDIRRRIASKVNQILGLS